MVSRLLDYLKSVIWVKKEKEFDEGKFRKIDGTVSRVFAVDGGNALVCDGGTWTISKVRTAVVGYEGKKRALDRVSMDLFLLVRKDGDVRFNEETKVPEISLEGIKLEDAPSEIRKMLEYFTAVKLLDELKPGDVVLLDSLLEPDYPFQKAVADELVRKAGDKGIHLLGVAKTSRLGTESGRSFVALLNEAGKKESWYYYPVSGGKRAFKDMVVRFHPRSNYCYRCQLAGDSTALATAASYSNDAELIGYPYPLLRADKVARINSHERDAERRNISMTARRMGLANIEYDILSQDMHERLDRRMYR